MILGAALAATTIPANASEKPGRLNHNARQR